MIMTLSKRGFLGLAASAALALSLGATAAKAETRVTLKSAKSTSSYYQMMVQLSEALKAGSDGALIATVEESQGSVQNVKEAAKRTGAYVFTTPPVLVQRIAAGEKPFKENDKFDGIRGLFPIPYLTMHWVVREDSGITDFAGLAGQDFIPGGKGSFGQRKTKSVFEKLGIADQVNMIDVELNAAVPAVKNRQVVGFATAGAYPAPNVMELAATTKIRLLSLSAEDIAKIGKVTTLEIPAGTYKGVDRVTTTMTLPVNTYTTTAMDEATAYAITKAFWQQQAKLAAGNSWWGGVSAEGLAKMGAKLHPGALRYYAEAGIAVPDAVK
jgi:TRAP transporter TAXI family solute receptor|tara:strand:- start:761 stop:1738 length:978 start_codon:yes stop_codon:yes gene_type:complete